MLVKGWECLHCGNYVSQEDTQKGYEKAEELRLPKLPRPRCPKCKSENVVNHLAS